MSFVRSYDAATAKHGVLHQLAGIVGLPRVVWDNRYMLQNFLRRDLWIRFKGSILGFYWILLQPLFLFAVYFAVFGLLLGNWRWGQTPDPVQAVYLFTGVIVFHSLMETTTASCTAIVDQGNLVKKVAFPSEVLLVHLGLVSLVVYSVSATVCVVAGTLLGALQPGWLLLALPLVLVVQFTLTLGMGFLLANLYVFVRDTVHLWRIAAMAWMFVSPVFWERRLLDDKLPPALVDWIVALNPAFSLIQVHRLALGGPPERLGPFWSQLGIAAAWAVAFLVVGYGVFMSRKHRFADLI